MSEVNAKPTGAVDADPARPAPLLEASVQDLEPQDEIKGGPAVQSVRVANSRVRCGP